MLAAPGLSGARTLSQPRGGLGLAAGSDDAALPQDLDVAALACGTAARVELPRLGPEGCLELPGGEASCVQLDHKPVELLGTPAPFQHRFCEDAVGNAVYIVGAYLIQLDFDVVENGDLWQLWVLVAGVVLGLGLALKNAIEIASDVCRFTDEATVVHLVEEAVGRLRLELADRVRCALAAFAAPEPSTPAREEDSGPALAGLEQDVLRTVDAAVSEAHQGLGYDVMAPWCCRSAARVAACAALLFAPCLLATFAHGKTYWPQRPDGPGAAALPVAGGGLGAGARPVPRAALAAVGTAGSSYPCLGHTCTALGASGSCRGSVVFGRKYDGDEGGEYTSLEQIVTGAAGPYAIMREHSGEAFRCKAPAEFPSVLPYDLHCICNVSEPWPSSWSSLAPSSSPSRDLLQAAAQATEDLVCSMVPSGAGLCTSGFYAGFDGQFLTEQSCKAACLTDLSCSAVSFCSPEKDECSTAHQAGTCSRFRDECPYQSLDVGEKRYTAHASFTKICKSRLLLGASHAPARLLLTQQQLSLRQTSLKLVGWGVLWGNVVLNLAIACLASRRATRLLSNCVLSSMQRELRSQLLEDLGHYFSREGSTAWDCQALVC